MHRFFIGPQQLTGQTARITGEDMAHMSRVLRLRAGDLVTLCDGAGMDYEARLRSLGKEEILLDVLSSRPSRGEPAHRVTPVSYTHLDVYKRQAQLGNRGKHKRGKGQHTYRKVDGMKGPDAKQGLQRGKPPCQAQDYDAQEQCGGKLHRQTFFHGDYPYLAPAGTPAFPAMNGKAIAAAYTLPWSRFLPYPGGGNRIVLGPHRYRRPSG